MGDDPVRRLTDNMMLTIPESERSRDKWAKRAFPAGDSSISTLRLWLAVSVLAGLLFIFAFVGNVAAGSYWWAAVFAVSVVFFCLQIARLVLWIRARRRAWVPDLDHPVDGRHSLSIMNPLASVIAGCAPGEPDCAAGTIPTGIDIWFILLMLLLVVAFVGCVALLVRRKMASRPEPEPRGFPPSGRA